MLLYISQSVSFTLDNIHAIYLFRRTRESGSHSDLSSAGIWGHSREINLQLTEDQFFILRLTEI